VIEMFRAIGDVRHELQENVAFPSVLTDLAVHGPRVEPIEHVFGGHEKIESRIDVVGRAAQSVQISAELA
jgi:hypothetical protein